MYYIFWRYEEADTDSLQGDVEHLVLSWPMEEFEKQCLIYTQAIQNKDSNLSEKKIARTPPPAQAESDGYDSARKALNWHGRRIDSLESVMKFSRLETLILSFCNLSRVRGLELLTGLRNVDLAFNKIETIQDMPYLARLQRLDLSGNLISDLEEISHLNVTKEFTFFPSVLLNMFEEQL